MESIPKPTTTTSDDDTETKERFLSSHKKILFNQLSPSSISGKSVSSSRSSSSSSQLSSLLSLKSTTTRESSKGVMHNISSRFTKVNSVIQAESCKICGLVFGIFKNKPHHCKCCQNLVCKSCSPNQMLIKSLHYMGSQRVCNQCFDKKEEFCLSESEEMIQSRLSLTGSSSAKVDDDDEDDDDTTTIRVHDAYSDRNGDDELEMNSEEQYVVSTHHVVASSVDGDDSHVYVHESHLEGDSYVDGDVSDVDGVENHVVGDNNHVDCNDSHVVRDDSHVDGDDSNVDGALFHNHEDDKSEDGEVDHTISIEQQQTNNSYYTVDIQSDYVGNWPRVFIVAQKNNDDDDDSFDHDDDEDDDDKNDHDEDDDDKNDHDDDCNDDKNDHDDDCNNDHDVHHIINAAVKRYTIPEYLMIDLNDDLSSSAIDDDLQHVIYSRDSILGFQHDGIINV